MEKMMSDTGNKQAYRSEIEQKVGRNVLLFQRMELLLKFLLTFARIEVRGDQLLEGPEHRGQKVKSKTLGAVVEQYLREVMSEEGEQSTRIENPNEASIEFSFRVESDQIADETKKQALNEIVNERNELIHNLLPRIDPNRLESYAEVIEYLDLQHKRALPHFDELKAQCAAMKNSLEFLSSDRAHKEVELAWLRQSRLVILLGEIASRTTRQDGWTSMSQAGRLMHEHLPGEMLALRETYGQKTLKELLVATELFDLKEEATKKGTRVLYRMKPGWRLE